MTSASPTGVEPEVKEPAPQPPVDEILDKLLARINPVTESTSYAKFLIYGPPGAGKTKLACSSPRTLLIDIERGSRTLLNHEDTKGTDVLEFVSIPQFKLLIERLKDGGPLHGRWDTLVVDSLTELQKRDLDDVLKKEAKADPSRNAFIPTGPDYNANTEHMRQIASDLRNLPMNVVFLATVKEEKDDSTGRILVRPNLTAKLSGSITAMCDTVGYLTRDDDGTRNLQVHQTPKVTAKTRIGGLDPVIKSPSMIDLINASKDNA